MVRAVVLMLPSLLGCGSVASARDAGGSTLDAPGVVDGLVAWYKMDTVADRVVHDATGHHDGTCSAASCPSLTASGRIGGGYVFDGIDDVIRVPSAAELDTTQGFTVTAWINRPAGSNDGCVVNKSFGMAGDNSWQACIRSDGALAFFSTGAAGPHAQTTSAILEPGRWYHLALWWNGTTKATYVDAARAASEDGIAIGFDDSDITIGSDIDAGALVGPFDGEIDDVRIYDRALSVTELAELQSP